MKGYEIMNITKSLDVFKDYCEGLLSPCYIKEYVSKLSDYEYDRFYVQVKEAMSYLIDKDYLIYKMFWIMKYPWNDLCECLFEELFNNLEGFDLSRIISEDKYNQLYDKYFISLKESFLG